MSKRNKNRLRKRELKKLKKDVSRFNKELKREKRKNPTLEKVVQHKSWKQEARKIENRGQYKRTIESIERAFKPEAFKINKSERSAYATNFQIEDYEAKKKEVNRLREKKRKHLEEQRKTSRSKDLGYTIKEMGGVKENALKPVETKFKNKSSTEWKRARRNIEKELSNKKAHKQLRKMKLNYIKGLKNAGFSDKTVQAVASMPLDKFYEMTQTEEQAEFDFIYDPIELKEKDEAIRGVWLNALRK